MSRVIWKFEINIDTMADNRDFEISMPANSRILSVQSQKDKIVFWAIVKPEAANVVRYFRLFTTGFDGVPDDERLNYLGTVQCMDGNFVIHVFEKFRG